VKPTPRTLAIFGSTGSIGRSTLEVVRQHPELYRVAYLSANRSSELLCAQVREFHPRAVVVGDPKAWKQVHASVGDVTEVVVGSEGLTAIAREPDYDTLINSLVGFAGLLPTIAAIESGKHIALANKETLVVAGQLISALLRTHDVALVPIDSEHSAILQCLAGESPDGIARIILTASGGPFRGRTLTELRHVTPADALRHPTWSMGHKISIDSATLMNKGLEVIEAHWLFGVDAERIDVVVHPQSIIHSMVEFADGSIKAQMGFPDMKLPILYALTHPGRIRAESKHLDFARHHTLTFEKPDLRAFRCLHLAYEALQAGGTAPACLNAANEIAVQAFFDGAIGFLDIPRLVEDCLERIPILPATEIDSITDVDARARIFAQERLASVRSQATHVV
jgi:1-deoxy-D-xylulose-5-phosphate reductoisomerase